MDVKKLMVVSLAGWINQHQEDVIDYLREEVRILKEAAGNQRFQFLDTTASAKTTSKAAT